MSNASMRQISTDELINLPIVPMYRIGLYDYCRKVYVYDDRYSIFAFEYIHRSLEYLLFHRGYGELIRKKYIEYLEDGTIDKPGEFAGPTETIGNKIAIKYFCCFLDRGNYDYAPAIFEKRLFLTYEKMNVDDVRKLLDDVAIAFDRTIDE